MDTVNRRAWNDFRQAHGSVGFRYLIEGAGVSGTAVIATVLIAIRPDKSGAAQAWIGLASLVISTIAWAALVYAWYWLLAPIRQRNEAREELTELKAAPALTPIDKTIESLKSTMFNCGDNAESLLEFFEAARVGLATTLTQYDLVKICSDVCGVESGKELSGQTMKELIAQFNIHDLIDDEFYRPSQSQHSIFTPQPFHRYSLSEHGKKVALQLEQSSQSASPTRGSDFES